MKTILAVPYALHESPRTKAPFCSRANARRAGYTLIELVAGFGAASLLVGGMASAMFLAGRTLDHGGAEAVAAKRARDALDHLTLDLAHATGFNERTPRAVTFDVPDRDSDGVFESIRYEWSGTAGDPLQMIYNGGAPAILAAGVYNFQLSYRTRSVPGTGFVKGDLGDPSLVAHWKFDDGSGSIAADSSPNALHATLRNGPTWDTGYWGGALRFNGSNQFLTVPHDDALSLTESLTITLWIYGCLSDFSDYRTFLYKGTTDKNCNYFFSVDGEKLVFGYNDSTENEHKVESPDVEWAGRWYHIAATMEPSGSGRRVRLYVDGVQTRNSTISKAPRTSTVELRIGRDEDGGKYYRGRMDDLRIYNRTLSADEIGQVRSGAL